METTMLAPDSASGPEQILEILEAMYSASGGKQGISAWQKQNILRGNADLLRFPHHVLVDRIGVGWKGEVYKARNIETGAFETIRTFAASSLNGLDGDEPKRLQQFLDRISKIAAVQHPTFPVIRSCDTCQNRHYQHIGYIVTEFIEGLNGRDAILRSIYGSVKDRLSWALCATARLARGLQIAHDAGIFHLDIHDKSIRFDSAGNIWLTDLGIAELMTNRHSIPNPNSGSLAPEFATLAPSPMGTPYIMAPEQLIGDVKPSSAIDIYNLGCTLCYLIVGEYPFKADNVSQLQQLVLSQSPATSDVVSQIARPIRPLIVRMLAKISENRPTAGEVANEIEELANSTTFQRDIESKNIGSWLGRTFANWWPRAKVAKESDESRKVW